MRAEGIPISQVKVKLYDPQREDGVVRLLPQDRFMTTMNKNTLLLVFGFLALVFVGLFFWGKVAIQPRVDPLETEKVGVLDRGLKQRAGGKVLPARELSGRKQEKTGFSHFLTVKIVRGPRQPVPMAHLKVLIFQEKTLSKLNSLSPEKKQEIEGVPHRVLDVMGRSYGADHQGLVRVPVSKIPSGKTLAAYFLARWKGFSALKTVPDILPYVDHPNKPLLIRMKEGLKLSFQLFSRKEDASSFARFPLALLWEKKERGKPSAIPLRNSPFLRTRIGIADSKGRLTFLDRSFLLSWLQRLAKSCKVQVLPDFPGASSSRVWVDVKQYGRRKGEEALRVPVPPHVPVSCRLLSSKHHVLEWGGSFGLKEKKGNAGIWWVPCRKGRGSFPLVKPGETYVFIYHGKGSDLKREVLIPRTSTRGKRAPLDLIVKRELVFQLSFKGEHAFSRREISFRSPVGYLPNAFRGKRYTDEDGRISIPFSSFSARYKSKPLDLIVENHALFYGFAVLPPFKEMKDGRTTISVRMKRRYERAKVFVQNKRGEPIPHAALFAGGSKASRISWAVQKKEDHFLLFGPKSEKLPLLNVPPSKDYLPLVLRPKTQKKTIILQLERCGSFACNISFPNQIPPDSVGVVLRETGQTLSKQPYRATWRNSGRNRVATFYWRDIPLRFPKFEVLLVSLKPPSLLEQFSVSSQEIQNNKEASFSLHSPLQVFRVRVEQGRKEVSTSGFLSLEPTRFHSSSSLHGTRVRSGDKVFLPSFRDRIFLIHKKWGVSFGRPSSSSPGILAFHYPSWQAVRVSANSAKNKKFAILSFRIRPNSKAWDPQRRIKVWEFNNPGIFTRRFSLGKILEPLSAQLSKTWIPQVPGPHLLRLVWRERDASGGLFPKKELRKEFSVDPWSSKKPKVLELGLR